MHGLGVTEVLGGLPGWVVALFALVTQLGDPWFVFSVVTLYYWLADGRLAARPRDAGATLVALALCALAATIALKSFFALPRPPGAGDATPPVWLPSAFGPAFVEMATGDGFGFPSGHALGSTVVYGGVAVLSDRLASRRRRYAGAGVVVAFVALSRLVLGVHVLFDVVAGALAGIAVLALVLRAADRDRRPGRAFFTAAVLSVVALLVALTGGHASETFEAGLSLGSAVGGVLGWRAFGERRRVGVGAAIVALASLGGLWALVYRLEPTLPGTVVGGAVAVGAIVALPGVVGWLRQRKHVDATRG